jgi:phosphoribosyl-AMP cyclohydrolase
MAAKRAPKKAKAGSTKAKKSSRTTHRSRSGGKLYAKRKASGQFEDVQTFERAHERDIKRRSRAEAAKKK